MRKKSVWFGGVLATVILVGGINSAIAQPEKSQTGVFQKQMDNYQSHYWTSVPQRYDPQQKWPLIITLHGVGDTAQNFLTVWHEAYKDYIIIAPKSPQKTWYIKDNAFIMECLDDIKKDYQIDESRVYLTGFSAGASGALIFGITNYKSFCGLGLVCGANLPSTIPDEAKNAFFIYFLIGEQDPDRPRVKQVSEQLQNRGFYVKYEEMAGVGHQWSQETAVKIVTWFEYNKLQSFAEQIRQRKELGKALVQLREKMQTEDETEKKEAEKLFDLLIHYAQSLKDRAKAAKEKDLVRYYELYQQIAREFEGDQVGNEAQLFLDKLDKDRKFKKALKNFRENKEPIKDRICDMTEIGFKIIKPEGREWELITRWPGKADDPSAKSFVCFIKKWKEGDTKRKFPLLTVTIHSYPLQGNFKFDDELIPKSDLKGYSEASFEYYKKWWTDLKKTKKPRLVKFRFAKKACQWSFYARHIEHKQAIYLRKIAFVARQGQRVYIMTIQCQPGEEKKLEKEIKYIFDHIKTYKPPRK